MTLAANLDIDLLRQRVDDRDPHTVEPAGDGVAAAAELPARVQDREDDLDGRLVLGLIEVDGDTAAVVDDTDAPVPLHRDDDRVAVAGKGLVHRVVHDFIDQVVESARAGRADVHPRTLTHGLEAFEHLDLIGPIRVILHRTRERGRIGGAAGIAVVRHVSSGNRRHGDVAPAR